MRYFCLERFNVVSTRPIFLSSDYHLSLILTTCVLHSRHAHARRSLPACLCTRRARTGMARTQVAAAASIIAMCLVYSSYIELCNRVKSKLERTLSPKHIPQSRILIFWHMLDCFFFRYLVLGFRARAQAASMLHSLHAILKGALSEAVEIEVDATAAESAPQLQVLF